MVVPESCATIQSSWGAKAPELFVALVDHYITFVVNCVQTTFDKDDYNKC